MSPTPSPRSDSPVLQGWLTVFQVLILALVVYPVATIAGAPAAVLLQAGGFATLTILSLPVIGLVLINRRSRFARAFWIVLLSLGAVVLLLTVLETLSEPANASDAFDFGAAVMTTAWMVYWIRSTRVRATFPPLRRAASDTAEQGSAPTTRRWYANPRFYAALIAGIVLLSLVFSGAPGSAFVFLLLVAAVIWLVVRPAWRLLSRWLVRRS